MKYELVKIDRKNNAILVSADGVQLWLDYFEQTENDEKYYTWEFNQYIFNIYNSKDIEAQETQNKIYEDVENFDYFMDEIFCGLEKEEK
jgi:hypothetical protein